MKKLLFLLAISFAIYGCSESTSPASTAEIKIVSEMTKGLVSVVNFEKEKDSPEGLTVDSIKITQIKVLMKELKLHPDDDDSTNEKVMKLGPFVYNVDSTGTLVTIATGDVPSGKYDKIKMEFHRFSSSEYSQYSNDVVFKDFATSDRYSVIIKGISYSKNIPTSFTFKAQTTANVELKFPNILDFTNGTTNTLSVQVDPSVIFKNGNLLYDPNDASIANKIENNIKSAFKSIKK